MPELRSLYLQAAINNARPEEVTASNRWRCHRPSACALGPRRQRGPGGTAQREHLAAWRASWALRTSRIGTALAWSDHGAQSTRSAAPSAFFLSLAQHSAWRLCRLACRRANSLRPEELDVAVGVGRCTVPHGRWWPWITASRGWHSMASRSRPAGHWHGGLCGSPRSGGVWICLGTL